MQDHGMPKAASKTITQGHPVINATIKNNSLLYGCLKGIKKATNDFFPSDRMNLLKSGK